MGKYKLHDLKIIPPYSDQVSKGIKNFEIRKNDRDFNVGDTLRLREWIAGEYTGRRMFRKITYILKDCPEYGLKQGFVILAIEPV